MNNKECKGNSEHGNDDADEYGHDEMRSVTPINLTVTLSKGTAVLPVWIVVLFAVLFVMSSLSLLIVLSVESRMMSEVRVMQIYEQDIENTLIRSGIATRADFAPHTTQGK